MVYDVIVAGEKTLEKPPNGKKHLDYYLSLANNNIMAAQFLLGNKYYMGEDVFLNTNSAFEWYSKAAENGHPEAKLFCYLIRQNLATDPEEKRKMAKYLLEAAESGVPMAQLYAGFLFQEGTVVERDLSKTAEWYLKSADQGLSIAECFAGLVYLFGDGVEINYEEAVKWFRKSANQNFDTGQYFLGSMYLQAIVPSAPNNNIISFVSYEEPLNTPVHYYLGPSLSQRREMHRNLLQAFKYFNLAASNGNKDAINVLGYMWKFGLGTPKNKKKSDDYFNLSKDYKRNLSSLSFLKRFLPID
jgi:TPR repeat protein